MPVKNKPIRLSSIARQKIKGKPCIVLDNQQDAVNHIYSLALVPAHEIVNDDGIKELQFPGDKIEMLNCNELGKFPIGFNMKKKSSYLVLAIVCQSVIPDFGQGGAGSSASNVPVHKPSAKDNQRDQQMVQKLIATQGDRLRKIGILINA